MVPSGSGGKFKRLESSCRDLHHALRCTALECQSQLSNILSNVIRVYQHLLFFSGDCRSLAEISTKFCRNSQNFVSEIRRTIFFQNSEVQLIILPEFNKIERNLTNFRKILRISRRFRESSDRYDDVGG